MFKTKKDIDRHVRANLAKLNENEKKYRGFTVAKLYFKINEFATASNYLSDYLSVYKEKASAYKLYGLCMLKLQKVDNALQSFQRSLQLDIKQPDILIEVCKLLMLKDSLEDCNAEYWCNLAELENIEDTSVLDLRLKLANTSQINGEGINTRIVNEIVNRPSDPNLRVHYIQHLIEQNKAVEALKHALRLELNIDSKFHQSIQWYEIVSNLLTKLKPFIKFEKDWDYLILQTLCLEKQLYFSFNIDNSSKSVILTKIEDALFNFDQYLNKVSQFIQELCTEEIRAEFFKHYRGQLCLYLVSIFITREITDNGNWKETTKKILPLLLLAYQSGSIDDHKEWTKYVTENNKQLINLWKYEGAFRCSQAGRTILSCANNIFKVDENVDQKINHKGTFKWINSIDILNEIQEYCSNNKWRTQIYEELFGADKISKMSTSYFITCQELLKPVFQFPILSELETYEQVAQKLKPYSLQHMTYLWLGTEKLEAKFLSYPQCKVFSTSNINCCGAETLNTLDMESFLYASAIQAKRCLELNTNNLKLSKLSNTYQPLILPFVNIKSFLCTEAQSFWWKLAYNICNSIMEGNLSEIRSTLKYGIETVRGINEQKMDLIIILKLAKIFIQRSERTSKVYDQNFIKSRAHHLYKHGLQILKRGNKGLLETVKLLFSYPVENGSSLEKELNLLAEDAVKYMASYYFQKCEYEECIELLTGIELPFAKCYLLEANKNLEEFIKLQGQAETYFENSQNYLHQPLNSVSITEMVNLSLNDVNSENKRISGKQLNNSNEINLNKNQIKINETTIKNLSPESSKSHHLNDVDQTFNKKSYFIENSEQLKQISDTLCFLKTEVINFVRPELIELRKDVVYLKEKLNILEEKISKNKPDILNPVDLNDYFMIANMQNPMFPTQQTQQQFLQNIENSHAKQQIQATNLQQHILNSYKTPLFNSNYVPMNNFPQYATIPSHSRNSQNSSFQRINQINPAWVLANQSPYENLNTAGHQNSEMETHKVNDFLNFLNQNNRIFPSQTKSTIPLSAPSVYQQQSVQNTPTLHSNIWNDYLFNNTSVEKISENAETGQPQPAPIINTNLTTPSTLNSSTIPLLTSNSSFTFSSPILNTGTTVATPKSLFSSISLQPNCNFLTNKISPILETGVTNIENDFKENKDESKDDLEYDARPDFQPIIPLPAEVKVSTGEENEEIIFSSRAKLFRFLDKEWKERGCGEFKILKSLEDGKGRILMRRDLTHKICANHKITDEINLIQPSFKNDEKCYIWAAHDYADEELKIEKFCIRFKEIETAKEFYKVFMKLQSDIRINEEHSIQNKEDSVSNEVEAEISSTIKYSAFDDKLSPFKNLNLGSCSSTINKPYETLFSCLNKTPSHNSFDISKTDFSDFSNKNNEIENVGESMNKSMVDVEDDYEPTTQFKPVIALPDLVEVETGEENENIIYEHRAKLLRYDKQLMEWKERGVGNIKILQNRDNQNKIRLIMRREKVQKLCCNQNLLKETKFIFSKNAKTKNSLIWVGNDYSESDLTTETFSLKFKTEEICKIFLDNILKLQQTMKSDDNKTVSQNKANATSSEGFGNEFKLKLGDWSCNECYVQNAQNTLNCVACKTSKNVKDNNALNKTEENVFQNNNVKIFEGFVEKFKPMQGSWSCKECYIQNAPDALHCIACKSLKNEIKCTDIIEKSESISEGFGDKFKPLKGSWSCKECYVQNVHDALHCVACKASKGEKENSSLNKPTENIFENKNNNTITQGFGIKFKPKQGSWTCKECYVQNSSDVSQCVACASPNNNKKDTILKENLFLPSTEHPAFSFGFNDKNALLTSQNTTKDSPKFLFGFNATPMSTLKTFGQPSATLPLINDVHVLSDNTNRNTETNVASVISSKHLNITDVTGSQNISGESQNVSGIKLATESPISLVDKISESIFKSSNDEENFSFGKKEFNFNFNKTKNPGKVKSPIKYNTLVKEDTEASGEEFEEEENNTYFAPIVHLEKVDVKTGEEDEEILYCHRAKLFRFIEKEWKERGLGDVKILKHKLSGKMRVIMRREQIHKLCLNHWLSQEVEYKSKDNKSWLFAVNDFSEGEIEPMQFCLRFKTKDIAENFMQEIKNALSQSKENMVNSSKLENKVLTEEDMFLPNEYLNQGEKCTGCRGCDPDGFIFVDPEKFELTETNENPLPLQMTISTLSTVKEKNKDKYKTPVLKQSLFSPPVLQEKPKSIFSEFVLTKSNKDNPSLFGTFSFNLEKNSISDKDSVSEGLFDPSSFTTGTKFLLNVQKNEGNLSKECIKNEENKSAFSGKNIKQHTVFGGFPFASFTNSENNAVESSIKNPDNLTGMTVNLKNSTDILNNGIFKSNTTNLVDFASLAKSANDNTGKSNEITQSGEFFGLIQQNSFDNFLKKSKDEDNTEIQNRSGNAIEIFEDSNFDPDYKPIIELPKEIVVCTGEENEEKLFGERATLFRFDDVNKEWKERGVGEIKILHHPIQETYRLLLRREQIHKLVLNQSITKDFIMNKFNNSTKSFCWGAINFVEEQQLLEKLAIRFKNADLAMKFQNTINQCLVKLKNTNYSEI